MAFFRRFPRNVWVLLVCQALNRCSGPMMIMVAGLLSLHIAPSPQYATLAQAFAVLGVATTSIPAALLMRRIGRKNGGFLGYGCAIVGALCGFTAAMLGNFPLILVAGFLLGMNLAFTQQYRFAVMESVPDRKDHGPAVSILLIGGIGSAFLGPEIGARGKDLVASPHGYAGSFLLLLGLLLIGLTLFACFFRNPEIKVTENEEKPRPLKEIVRAPVFIVAVCAAAVSYAVMSFIMTATPISMHAGHGHSLEHTKWVIQSHIAAMYLPSLIGGWTMRVIGVRRLLLVGVVIYAGMMIVGLQGHAVLHYWWSLVLLGVGWNFLFVGGTTLLPSSYRPAERFKVQAANDFLVFGSQAMASMSAGWVLHQIGWNGLMWTCLPPILVVGALSLWFWRRAG